MKTIDDWIILTEEQADILITAKIPVEVRYAIPRALAEVMGTLSMSVAAPKRKSKFTRKGKVLEMSVSVNAAIILGDMEKDSQANKALTHILEISKVKQQLTFSRDEINTLLGDIGAPQWVVADLIRKKALRAVSRKGA